jgi:excisionase family DNA binding protein
VKKLRKTFGIRKGESLNFTIAEASMLSNVSANVLRREVKRGTVRGIQIGGRWLIPRAEMARLVGLDEPAAENSQS